jgi:hypothetical protein
MVMDFRQYRSGGNRTSLYHGIPMVFFDAFTEYAEVIGLRSQLGGDRLNIKYRGKNRRKIPDFYFGHRNGKVDYEGGRKVALFLSCVKKDAETFSVYRRG